MSSTGMQPQSRPPDTQACPGGQAPSHAVPRTPPHGCVPETQRHVPPTSAQIGVSGGHSPQQNDPPLISPHGGPTIVVDVVVVLDVLVDDVVGIDVGSTDDGHGPSAVGRVTLKSRAPSFRTVPPATPP